MGFEGMLWSGRVPTAVGRCLSALRQRGIWHVCSCNPPVGGCAEAAANRYRLGRVGIPLYDELKSLMLAVAKPNGQRSYVLLHTRGHQRVDLGKASSIAGGEVSFVPERELKARFDAAYGTVTPLLPSDAEDVVQIVDHTVVSDLFPPYTMMTNCGHHEFAIEFRAPELFDSLPRTLFHDIVEERYKRLPQQATITADLHNR